MSNLLAIAHQLVDELQSLALLIAFLNITFVPITLHKYVKRRHWTLVSAEIWKFESISVGDGPADFPVFRYRFEGELFNERLKGALIDFDYFKIGDIRLIRVNPKNPRENDVARSAWLVLPIPIAVLIAGLVIALLTVFGQF